MKKIKFMNNTELNRNCQIVFIHIHQFEKYIHHESHFELKF